MKFHNHTDKDLNRKVAKALHQYKMISDGDRIVVALSGGKDSLTLLWILNQRLIHIPVKYKLFPVYLDPGFENGFSDALKAYCQDQGYDLRIEKTDFGIIAHSAENRENPCFLCSRLRRKRLFEIAKELNCPKLALGHNKDDLIETLFLNMCYAGEISTMKPYQPFFKGEFTIIRPLVLVDKEMTRQKANHDHFPQFINPCPSADRSQRSAVRGLLDDLYKNNRNIKGNIFRSMSNIKSEYLL